MHNGQANGFRSEIGGRVDAVREWRSWLTGVTGALILFESLTGLAIYLLPFSEFNQFGVLLHTVLGVLMLAPLAVYLTRHTIVRSRGNLNHYQVLGYLGAAVLIACCVTGVVLTWQGLVGPRRTWGWHIVHLVTGIAVLILVAVHLLTVIARRVNNPDARRALVSARRVFWARTVWGTAGGLALCGLFAVTYDAPDFRRAFPDDYNWRFGVDRPFAPSLARVDQTAWKDNLVDRIAAVVGESLRDPVREAVYAHDGEGSGPYVRVRALLEERGVDDAARARVEEVLADAAEELKASGAIQPLALAGSDRCGTSGCHQQIYEEWLPSAHRYSSMDDMFQKVQALMAVELSPEHTRYCAGCHDPISLFGGAKTPGNITLSVEGAHEGSSCLVCHSIVQTDVQGNADYTIRPPQRYVFELSDSRWGRLLSDFLIRTYPEYHITAYSRPLYKTPEFCGACHKQYVDREVNTDIGKVLGQNQYDSWKNSRWHHPDDPTRTITCRECHMPLVAGSTDPAAGDATDYNRRPDDGMHRSHRMLGGNQYMPKFLNLPHADLHTELIEKWLRGEYEIPEIADKWTSGPVIRPDIVVPEQVRPGETVTVEVVLTNNKTGHHFPTGPLDMIESWVELIVTDESGRKVYHSGYLDENDHVVQPLAWFKADGFDRESKPIDRHNLWDLVGAAYKRSLYPGVTDMEQVQFVCPSMARPRVLADGDRPGDGQRIDRFEFPAPGEPESHRLTITAIVWYRKANPRFLDRVYGIEAGMRSPITEIARATATVEVLGYGQARAE